jgi:hypothetical protein
MSEVILPNDDDNFKKAQKESSKNLFYSQSEKPKALSVINEGIPEELKKLPQWIVWRFEWLHDKAKWDKPPYNPKTGKHASSTDPSTWAPFEVAYLAYADPKNGYDGVGYVFTPDDPYCGIDLDDCRDLETETLTPKAMSLLSFFASYAELSPSGTGVKIITKARLPGAGKRKGWIEMYDGARYFTVTGQKLQDMPSEMQACQQAAEKLYRFVSKGKIITKQAEHLEEWSTGLGDDEVIDIASKAANGDKFIRLFGHGDISEYDNDHSRADAALIRIIAFYTGPCPEQIERIFSRSELGQRAKWKDRPQYRQLTIENVLATMDQFFGAGTHKQVPVVVVKKESLFNVVKANELIKMELAPAKWAVKEIIPEGLTAFAGKPKLGKSWLALNVGVDVTSGGYTLGKVKVEPGDVLYLALEDNKRRMQKRLRTHLGTKKVPERLNFAFEWPRQDKGGLHKIAEWLEAHPDARLVIIDTWQRFRSSRIRGRDCYEEDYAHASEVKALADKYGVAILLLHHCRKMAAEDPVDSVSGTLGFTGAADAVLVMRRERGKHDATLFVTGRDIEEECELAMQFEKCTAKWKIIGEAAKYRMSQERAAVIELLNQAGKPLKPSEAAPLLGKDVSATKKLLWTMKGDDQLVSQGGYYATPEVMIKMQQSSSGEAA